MPDTLRTVGVNLSASKLAVLTGVVGTQIAVADLVLSNTGAAARSVSLFLYTAADGTERPLPAPPSALAPGVGIYRHPGRIFLQPNDEVRAQLDAAGTVTAFVSYALRAGVPQVSTGFNPRGAWSSTATYAINDLVSLGGTAYVSSQNSNLNNSPDTSTAYWTVVASTYPALTGDVTSVAGNSATTIATGVVTYAKLATALLGSTSEILANVANKLLTVQGMWAANAFIPLTDAATIAVDLNTGINFRVTLAGNRTLALPTNLKDGQSGVIRVKQDATGSRTLTFASGWKFPGATVPVLSTAANTVDRFSYIITNDGSALLVEGTALEKGIA